MPRRIYWKRAMTEIDAAISLERCLLALESVHDATVIPRRMADEYGQGTESQRLVAYVVPAWSVRPDCIDEWGASLDRQWSEETAPDVRLPCDLIAVSRLP